MTAASAAREVAVSDAELITFGLVMEEAQRACAAAVRLAESERARAEGLQAELDALSDRLGAVIRASVAGERERAEARLERAREGARGFLAEYGDSKIPMFKVGQDLANSFLKALADPGAEVPGA